jgi:hypothetical protein
MDSRHDDNQFQMDMIASGDAHHHVEEGAAGDAINTVIYLNMSGDGIKQSRMMLINKPIMLTVYIYLTFQFFSLSLYIYISNNVDNDCFLARLICLLFLALGIGEKK